MTDREVTATKGRVLKAYRRWSTVTGMTAWFVDHVWYRNGTAGDGSPITAGRAQIRWEYFQAQFHWNLEILSEDSDDELDRIVRHEICHALVAEMREWATDDVTEEKSKEAMKHEERTVSMLASILKWTREQGQRDRTPIKKRK